MRTQRTFTFLLSFLFGVLIFSVIGFAAGESLLVDAAKRHDTTAVRGLIAKRADVNDASRDGSTALLWAAYHSDIAMTRALIAAGANPNLANKYGITPLLQASRTGADQVVQALLRAGADPSAGTSGRRNAADGRGLCRQFARPCGCCSRPTPT